MIRSLLALESPFVCGWLDKYAAHTHTLESTLAHTHTRIHGKTAGRLISASFVDAASTSAPLPSPLPSPPKAASGRAAYRLLAGIGPGPRTGTGTGTGIGFGFGNGSLVGDQNFCFITLAVGVAATTAKPTTATWGWCVCAGRHWEKLEE